MTVGNDDPSSPAVLLDFDGTLATRTGRWRGALLTALEQVDSEHNLTLESLRPGLKDGFPWHTPASPHLHLDTPERWWAELAGVFHRAYTIAGVSDDVAEQATAIVGRIYLDERYWMVFDDVRPALERLRDAGFRTVILSNHVPELADLVDHLGLSDLVPLVLTSATTGYEKPNVAAYDHALETLGRPETVWMVGDNLTADVDGAENAGIPGILVRTPDSHGQVLGLLDAAEKIIASVAHRVQSAGATADEIPAAVWQRAGVDPGEMHQVDLVSLDDGTGAASGQVQLITATFREGYAARLVRKTFRRLTSGPHAGASHQCDHWAYWRRELMAYRSGLLPTGSGLRAPRLYGTADNALYIEWVGGQQPTAADAATALGRWHCADRVTDHAAQFPWLARHQLGQRLDVSDLDWTTVDLDRRLRELWNQRHEYLSALEKLPWCITHGDFSIGNLRAFDSDVVALDWATLGVSPVGFDIAHLALATLDDSLLSNYLDGLDGRYGTDDVDLGYRIAVGLVGASRAHWMVTRSIPLPSGYADFVITQGP